MKTEFSRQIFEKWSCIKFHENTLHLEPCCSLRTVGRMDMTKLLVAFRNFAKAPKDFTLCPHNVFVWFLYRSQNKQLLSPYTASIGWFL